MSAGAERPLGGKILTPGFSLLLALIAVAGCIVLWRLLGGLGAVTAMSDGYPWGIWKPLNVVTFTGLAAGAYGTGLLCYVFNKGRYHPLVRSAIMAGAIGYSLAGTSVLVDLGRYWNLWVVFAPPVYNLNSVLLEVAICVLAYTVVLWIELMPAVLEQAASSENARLRALAVKVLPVLQRALPFVIALAILLPTMHQSSLGGLFMVAPTKLHPLWYTGWLPGLFLLTCLTMGWGSVVVIEYVTSFVWPRRVDRKVLLRLAAVPMWVTPVYLGIRLTDLLASGRLARAASMPRAGFYFSWFALEVATAVGAVVLLAAARRRSDPGRLFGGALLLVASGTLYRFDTYLTGFMPRPGAIYFPSVLEILGSLGFVAIGIAVYGAMVKRFPLLSGVVARPEAGAERTPVAAGLAASGR
jgi:Ni/Fe-hydrogenase subunit HybB-like protein